MISIHALKKTKIRQAVLPHSFGKEADMERNGSAYLLLSFFGEIKTIYGCRFQETIQHPCGKEYIQAVCF